MLSYCIFLLKESSKRSRFSSGSCFVTLLVIKKTKQDDTIGHINKHTEANNHQKSDTLVVHSISETTPKININTNELNNKVYL